VATIYKNKSLIQKMITTFKYKFSEEIIFILSAILKTEYVYFSQYCPGLTDAIFVPVPLHRKRLKYRGFNQSFLLADTLRKSLNNDPLLQNKFVNISIMDCLSRQNFTKEQAKLSRAERLKNLTNCFSVKPEFLYKLINKHVVLIDDVATTCSTLNECSKALKTAKVKHICGLVLARG